MTSLTNEVPKDVKPAVDLRLVKCHYFLLHGGLSALAPFVPLVATQRGLHTNLQALGLLLGLLPLGGCIAKPLYGLWADRSTGHHQQLPLLRMTLFLGTLAHFSMLFLPQDNVVVYEQMSNFTNGSYSYDQMLEPTLGPWFWTACVLLVFGTSHLAAAVSLSDAFCYDCLGNMRQLYGRQAMWGTIGWATGSFLAGVWVHGTSTSRRQADLLQKDYSPCFYLQAAMHFMDLILLFKVGTVRVSNDVSGEVKKVRSAVGKPRVMLFLCWSTCLGLFSAIVYNFHFLLLEELSRDAAGKMINLLEGLAEACQCLLGELPFFFFGGWMVHKAGHERTMSLVLVVLGLRCCLYSALTDPWLTLPIEILQGVTYGLGVVALTSFADYAAPPGGQATLQGLAGAAFEGLGMSAGSLLSGFLFQKVGGIMAFRLFGVATLVTAAGHQTAFFFSCCKSPKDQEQTQSSVTDSGSHLMAPFSEE